MSLCVYKHITYICDIYLIHVYNYTCISYNIFSAIDDYLEVHEIIKVSLLKTCDIDVREAALDISANTRSEIVQIIGRVIVLYRPSKERVIELPC